MNAGPPYLFANPNPNSKTPFNTDWNTKDVEFFELYAGPITTRYGEVFWQGLPPVPLPPDIVSRFDNKAMAIVGYEEDQVLRVDGQPDKPVPINAVYNHHYVAWMMGKHATMVKLDGKDRSKTGHPLLMQSYALNDPNPDSRIPTSHCFGEGNGGEMRKSYHGFPKGMAQLIDSPSYFVMTPMQIDTWNRNRSMWDPFVPGPEPKSSQAPHSGPDAVYSGHLECPCTDRIVKTAIHTFATKVSQHCASDVSTASLCFEGVAQSQVGTVSQNVSSASPTMPAGCSIIAKNNSVIAYFNTNSSSVPCGNGKGTAPRVSGITNNLITFALDLNPSVPGGQATITLTGPANVWFGVGLGAQAMADTPNAIIVTGNGTVFEEKLANQQAGTQLPTSVTVVQNVVKDGKRTVVLTRPFAGKTPSHYTFDPLQTTLLYINAIGKVPDLSYHAMRGPATMNLITAEGPTCLCDMGEKDYISSDMNPELQAFQKNCTPEPNGDLLRLKNPTCWLSTYAGGLGCCTSGNILLDKDQNPWADQPLTFWAKWRFYFQEFTNSSETGPSHENLVRFFHDGGGAGEYDVVKAPEGTDPEYAIYQITTHLQVKDAVDMCDARYSPHCAGPAKSGITLVYASGHCHAPSCLKMEIWNADTGMLICRQIPVYGQSPAATAENPYDEKGYLAIPPCLFGPDEGLWPAPYLSYDTNLTFIKWNNNTYGHLGEMAMWQMRGYQSYDPRSREHSS